MMEFPILYKYNSKGGVEQWQVFVDGDTYYTESGQLDGKLTKTKGTQCFPKNVGKANETTGEQQALSEATSKHQRKLDTHYNEVLTEKRSFYEPMLAEKIKDFKHLLFTVPTFIQAKYDGVRAINQDGQLTSRGGQIWVTCPHLAQDSVILDGELYNHEYAKDFNKLSSLFKKQKPTPAQLEEAREKGQLWVYDMPSAPGLFSERYRELTTWYNYVNTNPMIKLAPTFQIHDEVELEIYHETFLNQGYEGSIIRLDLGEYEQKRTRQVLKYKHWEEDEFKIVGFVEGKGNKAGMVGSVTLKLHDGTTCESNMEGTHDYSTEIWNNQDKYIGKRATVKFQNYTPDGKLRIPYVKTIGRDDYETV